MDFATVIDFLKQFETAKVMAYLKSMDLKTAMEQPFFLAGVGAAVLVALIMRWRLLLVLVMSVTGFTYLLAYTAEQGTSLDGGMPADALAVLIGGGSFIVFLAIYLLFIRSE